MKQVFECVSEVPALFEALRDGDATAIKQTAERISELEHKADEIKNGIRSHLPKSMFLPVERRDLLELLDMQDSVADSAQDISDIISLKKLEFPDSIRELVFEFIEKIVSTCREATNLADQFDELLEASFGGPESEKVLSMIDAVSRSEKETDLLGSRLLKVVVAEEGTLSPVSVFLWYQIVVLLGDMADYAEKMANRLRLFIAR